MGGVLSSFSSNTNLNTQVNTIRKTIDQHKVVIFSKSYCPYCNVAKQQFQKLSIPIHVIELDHRSDGADLQDALMVVCGSRTVPRCFINGKYVGGAADVKRLYEEGKLHSYFS